MLIRVTIVQECDATTDDSSNAAGKIKIDLIISFSKKSE
jgi:hypothetical protein